METRPCKDGVILIPETNFEKEYMLNLFTLNIDRTVTFDSIIGILKIKAIPRELSTKQNEKV
jgi:hypothetical protein